MQGVLAVSMPMVCAPVAGGLMEHGDVFLVLLSARLFSERFGAGARPVHPIRGLTGSFSMALPKVAAAIIVEAQPFPVERESFLVGSGLLFFSGRTSIAFQ